MESSQILEEKAGACEEGSLGGPALTFDCPEGPTMHPEPMTVPKSPFLDSRVGGGALARWPPSAAQTARAVFPHAAFTKTHDLRCKGKATPVSSDDDVRVFR